MCRIRFVNAAAGRHPELIQKLKNTIGAHLFRQLLRQTRLVIMRRRQKCL